MFKSIVVLATTVLAALAANHNVTVGENNTFAFNPVQVTAAVGDTITFTFLTRIHSVTSAMFSGAVCPPANGGAGAHPFDSGFLDATGTTKPTFVYTVPSTAPQFAACKQAAGAHCRMGMTFAINPTATMTFAQFQANAKAS